MRFTGDVRARQLLRIVTLAIGVVLVACDPGFEESERAPTPTPEPAGGKADGTWTRTTMTATPPPAYLLITPVSLEPEARRLQLFKVRTGRPTYLLLLEDVVKTYSGRDAPERVKRCIELWVKKYNVKGVTLVGDADRFPVRYVSRYLESFTPADLYYADLFRSDGSFASWDQNGNNVFGEMQHRIQQGVFYNLDGMDWYPDVAVARIPASSLVELRRFVDKVEHYELGQSHASRDHYRRVLLLTGNWGDDKKWQDKIAKSHLSHMVVTKQYYPLTGAAASFKNRVAATQGHLDAGLGFINYIGHGEPSGFSWVFNHKHLDPVTNNAMHPIVFSAGCNTGGFAPVPPFHTYRDVNGVQRPGGSQTGVPATPAPIQASYGDREAGPENWLVYRDVGAVGYVGPVGAGNPPYAQEMSERFAKALGGGVATFGGLWREMIKGYVAAHTNAHRDLVASGPSAKWHQKALWNMLTEFNSFGDASLQVGGLVQKATRVKLAARVGCFKDTYKRDLPLLAADHALITVKRCISLCLDKGYRYAGLQNGKQCFCGNSYGSHGPSGGCTKPCAADPKATCGGPWANEVYAVPLGCFKDGATRDLEHAAGDSASMTVQKCLGLCRSKGYRYAGLQYGKQCYCGNSYGSRGVSGACTKPCTGDAKQTCGGYFANTVYPVSVGCFQDESAHDLPYKIPATVVSVPFCIAECKAKGYRYAGLQKGKDCYCGNSYGVYGPSARCAAPCNGAPHQSCGGGSQSDIFPVMP